MPNTVQLTSANQIATITLNRPDAMNSYNDEMARDLASVTADVKNDASIRAVVLNGAGKLFMAGGDLQFFQQSVDSLSDHVHGLMDLLRQAVNNLLTMPRPVLASVHGSVAGVGMSLMMACDLVVAAESTKFCMAYSGVGLSPDGGASYFLPRIVGHKKAMQWLLLSEMFGADEALKHGLVNWVVADAELAATTEQLTNKIAHGPTNTYAHIKKLVNSTWDSHFDEQFRHEVESFASCATTDDFKAGLKAFLTKTQPKFEGR